MENREPVLNLELHAFSDASTQGVGGAVYAVVQQPSGSTQRLVAAKGRLGKQGLTVRRLELISAHMATNLVVNLQNTLNNLPNLRVYMLLCNLFRNYIFSLKISLPENKYTENPG